jgi:hypothetical protein
MRGEGKQVAGSRFRERAMYRIALTGARGDGATSTGYRPGTAKAAVAVAALRPI